MNTRALIAGLTAVLLLAASCDEAAFQGEETHRVRSPDGRVDAVVIAGSVDATTPTVHRLHIVPAEQPIDRDAALLLSADHVEGLAISWRRDRFLDLHYSEGRIFAFSNFWQSPDIDDWSYVVELRLNPPPDDFSLSARDRQMLR